MKEKSTREAGALAVCASRGLNKDTSVPLLALYDEARGRDESCTGILTSRWGTTMGAQLDNLYYNSQNALSQLEWSKWTLKLPELHHWIFQQLCWDHSIASQTCCWIDKPSQLDEGWEMEIPLIGRKTLALWCCECNPYLRPLAQMLYSILQLLCQQVLKYCRWSRSRTGFCVGPRILSLKETGNPKVCITGTSIGPFV